MPDLSAMHMKHEQRKAWEKFYRVQERPWRGAMEIDMFFDIVKRGSLVLDAGSGPGKSSKNYCKEYKIVLLDFSMNSLRKSPFDVNRILGDVRHLPFRDQVFDAIIAVHILDHIIEKERKGVMNELNRVLKKNGPIFIESFSVEDFRYGKGKEIEKNTFLRGNNIITHYFEMEEFLDLLNNFNIIKFDKKLIKRKILKETYTMVDFAAIGIKK